MNNKEQIFFGLLENGLDFIYSATEYIANSKSKSDLKYGVLHLSSGLELILKYKLALEHWSLLFQDVNKANKEAYESGNFISVSFESCIERLKNICFINLEDYQSLKFLKEKRNKLEHFSILDNEEVIKSCFNKVLSFLIDFIDKYIPSNDINDNEIILIEKIRKNLNSLNEFINHRMDQIRVKLKDSNAIECPSCFQEALVIDEFIKCYFCNYTKQKEEAVQDYISNILNTSEYECAHHGGEYPLYECPECGEEFLVHLENGNWVCFSCATFFNGEDIYICELCNTPKLVDTSGYKGICNDCFKYKLEKD